MMVCYLTTTVNITYRYEHNRMICDQIIQQQRGLVKEHALPVPEELDELYDHYLQLNDSGEMSGGTPAQLNPTKLQSVATLMKVFAETEVDSLNLRYVTYCFNSFLFLRHPFSLLYHILLRQRFCTCCFFIASFVLLSFSWIFFRSFYEHIYFASQGRNHPLWSLKITLHDTPIEPSRCPSWM